MTLLMKEVTLLNPISHPHTVGRSLAFAQSLLDNGIDVGKLISHIYSLEEAEEAIRTASYQSDETPIKVALDPTLNRTLEA
jgi:threonine dehydrogenase-like Zn-dependent dehydrogenase